jgi:transmembrane sensor
MKIDNQEFKRLLEAYIRQTATEQERKLLDRFFESYNQPVIVEEYSPEHLTGMEREMLTQILQRVKARKERKLYAYGLAAAATFALCLVASYLLFFKSSSQGPTDQPVATQLNLLIKSTGKGQKRNLTLPDGTQVRLNSNSSLQFPELFSDDNRVVVLEGEAFFNVTADASKPFVVQTEGVKTTVLGTSFNVRSHPDRGLQITLVEGTVNVEISNTQESSVLSPGQQATLAPGTTTINTVQLTDVTPFIEWKDDVIRFNATPMTQVVAQLEEWYGVDIQLKNKALATCRITARYEAEPLVNVLKSLEFMLKAKYTLTSKEVTLDGKGCNGNR